MAAIHRLIHIWICVRTLAVHLAQSDVQGRRAAHPSHGLGVPTKSRRLVRFGERRAEWAPPALRRSDTRRAAAQPSSALLQRSEEEAPPRAKAAALQAGQSPARLREPAPHLPAAAGAQRTVRQLAPATTDCGAPVVNAGPASGGTHSHTGTSRPRQRSARLLAHSSPLEPDEAARPAPSAGFAAEPAPSLPPAASPLAAAAAPPAPAAHFAAAPAAAAQAPGPAAQAPDPPSAAPGQTEAAPALLRHLPQALRRRL